MVASELAAELDCSGQMVGRRAKFLDQKGLVERAVENASRYSSPTDLARTAYFSIFALDEVQDEDRGKED